MDCIINGVTLQYCNSENNVLFVDSYKEIFFEIYNVEIGANSFVAELVNVTPKGPIVKVGNLTFGDKVYKDIEFLLLKEIAEIRAHVNESNITGKQFTVKPTILNETKVEDIEQIITEKIVPEVKIDTNTLYQVQKLKQDAIANIEKEKQKLQLVKEQVESENQKIESKLEEYKSNLLEHFYQVIEDGSNSITKTTEAKLQVLFDNLKQVNEEHFKTESKDIIQEHISNLTFLINSEKDKLTEQLNINFTKAVSNLENTLEDKINISFNDISNKQQKDLQKINESFTTELEKATVSLNSVLDSYKLELLNSFYEKVKEATESFDLKSANSLKETLQKLQETNKNNFDIQSEKLIKEAIVAITSDIENAKIKFNKEMRDELKDTTDNISKKILTSFQSETNKISLKIEEIDNAKIEINKELKELFSNLKEHLQESFNRNEIKFNANVDDLALLKEKYVAEFSSLLSEVKESVQKTFTKEKELIEVKIVELELLSKNLKLENDLAIEETLIKSQERVDEKLKELSVDSIYEKIVKEHGPRVNTLINEFIESQKQQGLVTQKIDLDDKSTEVLFEKFDFFKSKKVAQKFEQFVASEMTKREPELIRKIKKLILDFYYSYGSGGGSVAVQYAAGGTINGDLNVNGQILSGGQNLFNILSASGGGGGPTETPYSVFARSGLAGVSAVIDYFNLSAFNSAKYNIQVLSGGDVYSSTIGVLGNSSVAKYTEYAVLYTTSNPFINYAVNTTGTTLQLIISATPDLYNMIIKGVRLDPILQ